PRYRDGRQADCVHPRGDHTEYQAVRGRLGEDVPDRDQTRNPGAFPGIARVSMLDDDGLGQDGENKDRVEGQTDFVGYFVQEVRKAKIKFHWLGSSYPGDVKEMSQAAPPR